jgi:predicted transcriptional regulator
LSLKIAILLADPKTVTELANISHLSEAFVAEIIMKLKVAGAAETEESKWKLTTLGKEVLLKYFPGLSS